MKHVKKYEDLLEFDFQDLGSLTFNEAFEKFIEGQKIDAYIDATPKGYYTTCCGILCNNGYKYVHHGGGCSGEDCNSNWILDLNDNIIAQDSW
jgi:hypothetical protein